MKFKEILGLVGLVGAYLGIGNQSNANYEIGRKGLEEVVEYQQGNVGKRIGNFEVESEWVIPSSANSRSTVLQPLSNNDYILGGVIQQAASIGPSKTYLSKITDGNNIEWEFYPFEGYNTGYFLSSNASSIIESNNGFILTGFDNVVKFDEKGEILWAKKLNPFGSPVDLYSSAPLDNGGAIVVGRDKYKFGQSYNPYNLNAMFLAGINGEGNVQWYYRTGIISGGDATGISIKKKPSGNYLVLGHVYSSVYYTGNYDRGAYLLEIDLNGRQINSGLVLGTLDNLGKDIEPTSDEEYIYITGIKETMKLKNQEIIWRVPQKGSRVKETQDGNLFIFGNSILLLDPNGNKIGEVPFSDNGIRGDVKETPDGDYLFLNGTNRVLKLKSLAPKPQPPLQLPGDLIQIPEGTKNLVVVTHGWNPPGINFDNGWVDGLVGKLTDNLNPEFNRSEWTFLPFYWSSNTTTPREALINARNFGAQLGKEIAQESDLNYFHIIAHSAGDEVANEAAKKIRNLDPNTIINITFLDPYTPGGNVFGDNLAKPNYTDVAINYYVPDSTGRFTGIDLFHTHNVNLSLIDQLKEEDHRYPPKWYTEGFNQNEIHGTNFYGPIRDLEFGGRENWEITLSLSRGNNTSFIPRVISGDYDLFGAISSKSLTGVIKPEQNGFKLTTGSPVWVNANVGELPPGTNFLMFNSGFVEGNGDGELLFYFNRELIYRSSNFIEGSKINNTGRLFIGDIVNGLENSFSVRLDPTKDVPLEAIVNGLKFGKMDIPKSSVNSWRIYKYPEENPEKD